MTFDSKIPEYRKHICRYGTFESRWICHACPTGGARAELKCRVDRAWFQFLRRKIEPTYIKFSEYYTSNSNLTSEARERLRHCSTKIVGRTNLCVIIKIRQFNCWYGNSLNAKHLNEKINNVRAQETGARTKTDDFSIKILQLTVRIKRTF